MAGWEGLLGIGNEGVYKEDEATSEGLLGAIETNLVAKGGAAGVHVFSYPTGCSWVDIQVVYHALGLSRRPNSLLLWFVQVGCHGGA